ncbi:MAG: hypothetical protein KC464_04135 [Myxococcales bacterium]|nr:hypothetical protein [Myxococcales bacterium]
MMIEIVAIEDPSSPEPRVEVRSELGQFTAFWSGPAPVVGATRAIEFSFGHTFRWNQDIVEVEARPHAIEPRPDGGAVLWATVLAWHEEGGLDLRLGPSFVMLEAFGYPAPVGATVRLDAPRVTLFDCNI